MRFRSGFTLIELLIVVVLIAIVTSMALPRIDTARFRADASMRAVQAVLQQAERSAVQRQTDVVVSFDIVNQRVRILYDANNDHAISDGEEFHWVYLEEGSHFATPTSGVNGSVGVPVYGPNMATSGEGYPTVSYRRDGASSTSFEVYLRSSSNTDDDFRALLVAQATGRVSLYHYGNNAWHPGSL
jgi:prepilin-type N-terminal cleavage/methylation domain-containing protein